MAKLTEPGIAARLKSDRAVGQARRLRKSMTKAERMLWRALRHFPLENTHFRKQAPIGPFIVDFVCHDAKLIIELHGGAHDAPNVALRDQARNEWLRGRGYRLLVLRNEEVERGLQHVLATIDAELRAVRL